MTQENKEKIEKTLFYSDDHIQIRLLNGNPNFKGGQQTNGPQRFWFKETGSGEWYRTFCNSEISGGDFQRLLKAGLNFTSLRSILFAGGRI